VAASTGNEGDVVGVVVTGGAVDDELPSPVRCPDGLAQATFIFPLAHTATVRVALPIGLPSVAGPPSSRRRRPATTSEGVHVRALPDAARVVAGWHTQSGRGLRLVLPDDRLAGLVDRARRHLLLVPGGNDLVSVPDQLLDYPNACSVLGALDAYGYHDEVDRVLDGWPDRQAGDGWFIGEPARGDRNGAALAALGRHRRLLAALDGDGDADATESGDEELAFCVSRAARALDKALDPRGRAPAISWRDAAWSIEGWRHAAALLDGMGQPDAAALVRSASWPARVLAGRSPVGGPGTPLDVGGLDLVGGDPWPDGLAELVDAIRGHLDVDGGVLDPVGPRGLVPAATARLARAELALGLDVADPWRRLGWLAERSTPTGTWPEVVHPRTGRGIAGAGHDPTATAEVLRLVRELLVVETADGLALAAGCPPDWFGQGLEVHDAPTAFGRCSYAVRWHGERPALLWEVEGGGSSVRLTAPALDPAWSSTERRGEALLAAPVATQPSDAGGSFA
jgi:hypothetical protein